MTSDVVCAVSFAVVGLEKMYFKKKCSTHFNLNYQGEVGPDEEGTGRGALQGDLSNLHTYELFNGC